MSGMSPFKTVRVSSAGFTRPAALTQYTAGDEVSNNTTAGSVVRATFDMSGYTRGHPKYLTTTCTPASGNMVVTAADFEILLFKTDDVPAAVGDNTTHPLAATDTLKAVGRFLPVEAGWLNQLGAAAGGTSNIQKVEYYLGDLTAGTFEFNLDDTAKLTLVMRALSAWNPGNVAQAFTFELELEV